MKTSTLFALALALAAPPLGAAQLYRWVDDKGNVEWRDTPPPSTAKHVEKRNVGSSHIETSTLPYSLQQAVKNHPVTLWAFDCGDPCNDARAHLARRGVPYTERDAQRENEALKKLSGGQDVPLLLVGNRHIKGYQASEWDAALDAAGYPSKAIPGVKTQPPPAKAAQPTAKPAADQAKAPTPPPAGK